MSSAFLFDLEDVLADVDLLPSIASDIGGSDDMAVLTRAVHEGAFPRDVAFRLQCLILGQIPLGSIQRIASQLPLKPQIQRFIRASRDRCFLVAHAREAWVQPIAADCGCRLFACPEVEPGDSVCLDDAVVLSEIRANGFDRIVAIGSGVSSVPFLAGADVAIAYGGGRYPVPAVIAEADYVVLEEGALCRLLQVL